MENDYLVKKKPILALFIFALPMIIGNFFSRCILWQTQLLLEDMLGEEALAAVGVSVFFDYGFYLYCHWWRNRSICYS